MRDDVKKHITEKLEEIKSICDELGYETEIEDVEKTILPTIIIYVLKDGKNGDITVTCNLIPSVLSGIPVMFLQLYMCISSIIPDDKLETLNEFIRLQNERFMIGNILNFSDCVCMKYSLYFTSDQEIDKNTFARSLDVFIYQANVIAKKAQALISGNQSLSFVMEKGTFDSI